MSRSTTLACLFAALALAACGGSGDTWERAVARGERPRHVVLFVVDTLRADRLGCYGYPRDTSPGLDVLARRGTLFLANHAQGCWTLPSMLSMLSGLYVFDEEQSLPAGSPTLAELLARGGVCTAAFVGNDVLLHDRGFERGFEHFEGPAGGGFAQPTVQAFAQWFDDSRARIEGARGFFAWIHVMDPHEPYDPPERFARWTGEPRPDLGALAPRWEAARERAEGLAIAGTPSFEEAVGNMTAGSNAYDGEVLAVDNALRRLVRFLEMRGVLDETLILVASDHGEKLWEHEQYPYEVSLRVKRDGGLANGVADLFTAGHRAWFHQELWRTPLVAVGPGFEAGARVDALTGNLDLFPTILDAFGLAAPRALHGSSLLDATAAPRGEVFGYGYGTTAVRERGGLVLVEHDPRRFRLPADAPAPLELWDVEAEPDQTRSLEPERPDDARRLAAVVASWRAEVHRDVSTSMSEKAAEALRRMGYVDGL